MVQRSLPALCRAVALVAAVLASGDGFAFGVPKHEAPIPAATLALMSARDTRPSAPILMRIFKKESELEVWKQARSGRYVLVKTFPICRWSGQLGPKMRTGDRQAPEGFYSVGPNQMNPNSAYHLSFDLGYPNAYDKAQGGSGSFLMVHGTCSSAGCYAMTDKAVEEIYSLAREAFAGGQKAFQVHAYPFRMNAENMAKHRSDPNIGFWRQLKEGSDRFEALGEEPAVGVSGRRYVFGPSRDAAKEAAAAARVSAEAERITALVADGSAAIRTTYADGGQHTSFRALAQQGAASLGLVSRPEALAFAGRELVLTPARPKRPACPGPGCPTQVAEAKPVPAAAPPAPPRTGLRVMFSDRALGAGPVQAALAGTVPGSASILPSTLTAASFEVAARH